MIGTLTSILGFASASPLAALALKATFILSAGAVVAWAVQRSSAATRHLVWMVTLSAVVGLAAASVFMPPLPIPMPGLAAPAGTSAIASKYATEITIGSGTQVVVMPSRTNGPAAQAPELRGMAPDGSRTSPGSLNAAGFAVVAWLLGGAAVAGRLLLGQAGLTRLVRGATPLAISQAEWYEAGGSPSRPVRFFRSRRVGSPVTWGFVRPVVLLPEDVDSWPMERRRVVLAHELAHVERWDSLAQWIAGAACALYWFNPLVWMAARRLRLESEQACDDRVLSIGTPGADYAAHLLDVARQSHELGTGGMLAIGMARRSQFEGRLLAVLDDCRSRRVPKFRGRAAGWIAAALVVLPLAAVRAVPPAAAERGEDIAQRREDVAERGEDVAQRSNRSRQREQSADDYDFDRTLPAEPGETLVLDLDSGGSIHVSGWNEPRVSVQAWLGGEDWRDTRIEFDREDDILRLHSYQAVDRASSSTSHQFHIRVPRRFNLTIRSAGGDIDLADLEGDFSGNTGGGRISIREVDGKTVISTGGGEIEVHDSNLDGSVTTGGGLVKLSRVRGGLKGSSGSGPVIHIQSDGVGAGDLSGLVIDDDGIHVSTTNEDKWRGAADRDRDQEDFDPGDGVVHIEKAGGSIVLREAPHGADVNTGGGDIRIGEAGGPVRASTGGGSIEIGPVDGPVRASTGSGDIDISITGGRDDHSVSASSGSGSVVIELPSDFSGTFELETAYTRNFERKARIESDWHLEQRESRDWDDSQGTRRKYVRASGQIGDGENLVSVRIVNGDITIRKRR